MHRLRISSFVSVLLLLLLVSFRLTAANNSQDDEDDSLAPSVRNSKDEGENVQGMTDIHAIDRKPKQKLSLRDVFDLHDKNSFHESRTDSQGQNDCSEEEACDGEL